MADSVTFTATTIAPDFHLVTVLLAIGLYPLLQLGDIDGGLYKINMK